MFASCGNEIKIWNLEESYNVVNEFSIQSNGPSRRPKLPNQKTTINGLSIKPDSTWIASVVDKDTIYLLSLENGSQNDLRDTFDSKCCAYDSIGRNLVVGNSHGMIDIFDFKSQTQKRKSYKIHPDSPNGGQQVAVNWIGWSKNDRYIATGNSDGSIVLFNAVMTQMNKPLYFQAFRQTQNSPLKNVSVTAMNYSTFNPGSLGAAYDEGSVALWDTNKESVSISYKAHNLPCSTIALSPVSGMLMVSGGVDGLITLYDVNQKRPLKSIEASKNGIASIEFFKNGYLLCVGTLNGQIQVIDLRNDQQAYNSFKAHDTSVNSIKILQNISSQQMKFIGSLKSHSLNSSNLENTLPHKPSTNNSYGNSLPTSAHVKQEQTSAFSLQNQILKKSNSYSNSNLNNNNNHTIQYESNIEMFSPEALSHVVPRTRNNENQINTSFQNTTAFVLHKKLNSSTTNLSSNVMNSELGSMTFLNVPNNNGIKRELELTPNNINGLSSSNKTNNSRPSKTTKTDLYSPIANSTGINNTIDSKVVLNEKNTLQMQPTAAEIASKNLETKISNSEVINNNGYANKENTPVETSKFYNINENTVINENLKDSPQISNNTVQKSQNQDHLLSQVDQKIQKVIWDIEDNHDRMMSENYKFKLEMFKEFMSLKQELTDSIKQHSINEALLSEVIRLKEENKRLKKLF